MAITLDDALKMYQNQQSKPNLPPKEFYEHGAPAPAPSLKPEDVTLSQLEDVCALISDQRLVCDQVAAVKKAQDKILEEREAKLLDLLKVLEKTSYQSKVGTFSISHRLSVRVPGSSEDRALFFSYLKERDLFEQMITVNSATLNSFYKAEFEIAKEKGDGMDFAIPGIGEASIQENISFRKAK